MKRSLVFGLMCSMVFAVACGDDDGGGGGIDAGGGGADSGGGADADPTAPDAAPTLCTADFAGCETFTDMTGDKGPIEITAGVGGSVYSPRCIRITTAQSVTIQAAAGHPLNAASCSPNDFVDGAATTEGTYSFTAPGIYGFYCGFHGSNAGTGMAGAIEVVDPP